MHFSSIQFSHSVMSDSSDPMDCSTPDFPVHHQLPELAQTHGRRVSDAIQPSHSLYPLLLHLQSFPASGSFQMSQFLSSGGQSTGASASASVLPMNIQDSNHLILCLALLLLPSVFLSIRVFSSESVLHIWWPKCWSFSFRISSSNEYSRLISFRVDWFDLLAVQEILKSVCVYHTQI